MTNTQPPATNSTSVSRAIRKFAGIRPHTAGYEREGVHVTGPAGAVEVNIYAESSTCRWSITETVEAALNMAGYDYRRATVREGSPYTGFVVRGKRDRDLKVPPDAPLVRVAVTEQGKAVVGIGGRQVQGRIGYGRGRGGRFAVTDSDTEQVIARADNYREAGELFARWHLVRGPMRVEVHHETDNRKA